MDFTLAKPAESTQIATDLLIWRLSIDGAANAQGSGAGLILTSLEGIDIEYALRFGFQASNNEAKYEVVIVGLNLAHSMEVDQLLVCSDSQLVVRQIKDTYEVKGEKNDPIPQKGMGITKEIHAGSSQTHTQSGELPSRYFRKTGHSLPRRPRQTDARRAPRGALHRSHRCRGLPCHVRAKMDGPHLGLLNRRIATE